MSPSDTQTAPSLVKEQLTLLIERELRYQLDTILQRLQKLAKDFEIGARGDKRSPLRNLLITATDQTASIEVIKNYITYQTARSEDVSKILKLPHNGQLFGKALVEALEALKNDADAILTDIADSLPETHPVKRYLATPARSREVMDLHLKLAQLYLGYLVREHTALVKPKENHKGDRDKKAIPSKPRQK